MCKANNTGNWYNAKGGEIYLSGIRSGRYNSSCEVNSRDGHHFSIS